MSDSFNQGVLVTIVCETVLQDRLIQLLIKLGVSGYTISPVQGAGSHGKRTGDMAGYNTNIEVKTIEVFICIFQYHKILLQASF